MYVCLCVCHDLGVAHVTGRALIGRYMTIACDVAALAFRQNPAVVRLFHYLHFLSLLSVTVCSSDMPFIAKTCD